MKYVTDAPPNRLHPFLDIALLLVILLLIIVLFVYFAPSALAQIAIKPTTNVSAETANNTSASVLLLLPQLASVSLNPG